MADEDSHPFRWVPTLQHMSQIKIIETLWRNFNDDLPVINECMYLYQTCVSACPIFTPARLAGGAIMRHVEASINQLPLPRILRTGMKGFLVPMIYHALLWFRNYTANMRRIWKEYDLVAEAIRQLVNIRWTNIGYVDVRQILVEAARTKLTTDFHFWSYLCDYCIEDEIIRLGRTIDWPNIRNEFQENYQFYWYHQITGEFPTQEMCLPLHHGKFMLKFEENLYNRRFWLTTLLEDAMHLWNSAANVPSITYYRDKLQNNGAYNRMVRERNLVGFRFTDFNTEVTFFFLRSQTRAHALRTLGRHNIRPWVLMLWPSIRFADDWAEVLGRYPTHDFTVCFHRPSLFYVMSVSIHDIRHMSEYEAAVDLFYNDILPKVWREYYRRFQDDETLSDMWQRIFYSEWIMMCAIAFRGLGPMERRRLIRLLGAVDHLAMRPSFYEFCGRFSEQVLHTDEERRYFNLSCNLELEIRLPANGVNPQL